MMGVAKGALGPWLPYLIFILCRPPTLQKGHTTVEWTWWRHHRNANAFVYLSVILAPFGIVFGYFWLKKSGNPVLAYQIISRCVRHEVLFEAVISV